LGAEELTAEAVSPAVVGEESMIATGAPVGIVVPLGARISFIVPAVEELTSNSPSSDSASSKTSPTATVSPGCLRQRRMVALAAVLPGGGSFKVGIGTPVTQPVELLRAVTFDRVSSNYFRSQAYYDLIRLLFYQKSGLI
jgi:hypothetical protein